MSPQVIDDHCEFVPRRTTEGGTCPRRFWKLLLSFATPTPPAPSPSPSPVRCLGTPFRFTGNPVLVTRRMRGDEDATRTSQSATGLLPCSSRLQLRCSSVQSSPVQFSSPWRLGLENRGFLWFRWKKKGQRTKQTQSMIESETVSTWGKQSPGPHPLCLHLPSPSQSAIAAPGGRRIASKLTKLHHSEDLGSAGSFFLDILLETDRG
jgi:hypothetical protein